MKEAAFIMSEYGVQDPYALTPRMWSGLIIEAANREQSCG